VIILDTSVATKWFVPAEPLAAEAERVLDAIAADPQPYAVPELFMNELLAVLARLPGATTEQVVSAVSLVESLGLARIGNGHELLATAAGFAGEWGLSGYDAVYVATAALGNGVWLTARWPMAGRPGRSGARTSSVFSVGEPARTSRARPGGG
jgi:predicted nucleic acid-binding protein